MTTKLPTPEEVSELLDQDLFTQAHDAYRACYERMEAAERVCEAAAASQQFDFLPQNLDDLASGLKAKVNLLNALAAWKEKTK